jgi:hypothetical protein
MNSFQSPCCTHESSLETRKAHFAFIQKSRFLTSKEQKELERVKHELAELKKIAKKEELEEKLAAGVHVRKESLSMREKKELAQAAEDKRYAIAQAKEDAKLAKKRARLECKEQAKRAKVQSIEDGKKLAAQEAGAAGI